jgi:hypothetical protein
LIRSAKVVIPNEGGKYKTIEDLMRAKGEEVQRGEIFVEGITDQPKAEE